MIFIDEKTKKVFLKLIDETEELYKDRMYSISKLQDIKENSLRDICKIPIDLNLKKFVYTNISNKITMKYSYCGLRYGNVYIRTPKKLLNGSDPKTLRTLYNALKYQYLSNFKVFDDIAEKDKEFFLSMYAYTIMHNINNSITFNIDKTISYDPITLPKIYNIIKQIITEVNEKNFDIYDLNGCKHTLEEKYTYIKMERFTKEEITNIIEQAGTKPTIEELALIINLEEQKTGREKYVSNRVVKYYIDKYDLRDIVKLKKRSTKTELQNKKQ